MEAKLDSTHTSQPRLRHEGNTLEVPTQYVRTRACRASVGERIGASDERQALATGFQDILSGCAACVACGARTTQHNATQRNGFSARRALDGNHALVMYVCMFVCMCTGDTYVCMYRLSPTHIHHIGGSLLFHRGPTKSRRARTASYFSSSLPHCR